MLKKSITLLVPIFFCLSSLGQINTFLLKDSCKRGNSSATIHLFDHGLDRAFIDLRSEGNSVIYPLNDTTVIPQGEYTFNFISDSNEFAGIGFGANRYLEDGCFYSLHLTDSIRYTGHFFTIPIGFYGPTDGVKDSSGLKDLITWLKEYSTVRIEVGAHDISENTTQNLGCLSCSRAKRIKRILVGAGIDAERVRAVGYGYRHPLYINSIRKFENEANERIVIRIIGT